MRAARVVLEELTSHVMPPRGIAIEIKEMPSKGSKGPNWVARVSAMNSDRTQLFSEKVLALRKSDRLIDWEDAEGQQGHRRLAMWASEIIQE
jgi:hypothetical protein